MARTAAMVGALAMVAAVAVFGAVLALHAPAAAHNQLVSSDPDDGDRVEQAPERITLTFLSTVDAENVSLDVTGPDGASVADGDPAVEGSEVAVPVVAPLPGDYQIEYEVLSSDGHWVDGTVGFTVTEGDPEAAVDPSPPEPSPPSRPSPTPEATDQAGDPAQTGTTDESGGPTWWIWPVLAVLALGGGYAGYRLVRRRAGSPSA